MLKSPFKFLDSYTLEDRAIFFGRDQEITELYRRVFESKILLVYGVSGTGKSSLINCGLASRFDDSDWLPVNVRRGNNIIVNLNEAFKKQVISPFKKNISVSETLQSIYLDHFKPVYLIFDQFEELFIFGSTEEKSDFIKLIKEVVDSKTQCHIVFVIREEFLAGITEFEYELPEIFSNRFRVEKMKRSNAIQAVEGPCKVHNIKTETGFSEELVDKLCPAGDDIELTYLQIYLDRIFRIASANSGEENLKFTKEMLSKAGNVSDLLGQFLEEKIGEMEDPNTATSILKSFVSVQGTKKQMNESEITDSIGGFGTVLNESELIRYLEKFVDLRILRERDESGHFELRHDSLALKIYEKFTALEKDIIEVRQFIDNAFLVYEKRGKLFNADDLKYIAPYEDKLYLSKSSEAFINKSKNEITRIRRRRTTFAGMAAIALIIVLSGFAAWAMTERKKAVREREIAEVQKDNALIANNKAIKSEEEALEAKNQAVENEKAALLAKEEAETSKNRAIKEEALALREKKRAIVEQEKATNALQAKIEAERKLEETAKNFVLSPERMNVLYRGIENSMTFAIPGTSSGRIYFKADQNGEIHTSQGKFSVIPYNPGGLNITLFQIKGSDTIELGTRSFRVKNLPEPVPYIEGKNSGYILRDSLVNTVGIQIVSADFDYDIKYRILGYDIKCTSGSSNVQGHVENNNDLYIYRNIFNKIRDNTQLTFNNIMVIGPDSVIKNLGSINLMVLEKYSFDNLQFFLSQVNDFIAQKNWNSLKQMAIVNIDKYYENSTYVLNDIAYNFYLYIDDTVALKKALKWAERSLTLSNEEPMMMDTYASLLFKLGELDEAEKVEQNALTKVKARNEPTDAYENLLKQIRSSR